MTPLTEDRLWEKLDKLWPFSWLNRGPKVYYRPRARRMLTQQHQQQQPASSKMGLIRIMLDFITIVAALYVLYMAITTTVHKSRLSPYAIDEIEKIQQELRAVQDHLAHVIMTEGAGKPRMLEIEAISAENFFENTDPELDII